MRRSIDGLAGIVREQLGVDPLSGDLFGFANRRRDRLKLLVWDESGFWVFYKRLERGTFAWPSSRTSHSVTYTSTDMALLLGGLDVVEARPRNWYSKLAA